MYIMLPAGDEEDLTFGGLSGTTFHFSCEELSSLKCRVIVDEGPDAGSSNSNFC